MFVYVDKNGLVKEIIGERPFRAGDSVKDKIYIYYENAAPESRNGYVQYTKADGTTTTLTRFFDFQNDTLIGKELPVEPKRNLEYFDYNHTYEDEEGHKHVGYLFYELTVPDEVLASATVNYKNCIAIVKFILPDSGNGSLGDDTGEIDQIGEIVFAVNGAHGILPDNSIGETEFNYLLKLIKSAFSDIVANPIGTPTANLLTVKIKDVIYKVSIAEFIKRVILQDLPDVDKKKYTFTDHLDRQTIIEVTTKWLKNIRDADLGDKRRYTVTDETGTDHSFEIPVIYLKRLAVSTGLLTLTDQSDVQTQINIPDDDYLVNLIQNGSLFTFYKLDGSSFVISSGGGTPVAYLKSATYGSHTLSIVNQDNDTLTVPIPYKTSDLTNDSGFIDSAALTVALADYYTKDEIDAFGFVTKDVDNLTNYTKTVNLATVALTGAYSDLIGAPEIVDNLTTQATNKVLSANQGFEINKRLNALEGLGRYLALWFADLGEPENDPPTLPYELKNGDYFIVGQLGTTNYKPHVTLIDGVGYYDGTPSTDVETRELHIKDMYIYDGLSKSFRLLSDTRGATTWASIIGDNPLANTALAGVFSQYQKLLVGSTDISINPTTNVITFTNASGYLKASDIGTVTNSHLSWDATNKLIGVASGYQIPSTSDIAQINTNKEDIAQLELDLDLKQNITDNGLSTTSKQIVGAINELKLRIDGVDVSSKQDKVDGEITFVTDHKVVSALMWLFNNKVDKITTPAASDRVYAVGASGGQKLIPIGELGGSTKGDIIVTTFLNTVEDVIAAKGGVYWDLLCDEYYKVWERTDVLPTYNVTGIFAHLSLENPTLKATYHQDYTNKLVAEAGHSLPDNIQSITIGSVTLTTSDYEYDSDTGEFTIHGEKINGDISIIAEGV